ncbi:MAG: hypothetical protein IJ776_05390 [Paludibacteraceae bacterium]|nr:hypothetical protein [Paludibacteraceae bacterium]
MKANYVCMLAIVALLSACNTRENTLVGDLKKFTTELIKDCGNYSEDDWQESRKVYDALKLNLNRTELNEKEKNKVAELQKICEMQYSLRPVRKLEDLTGELGNYHNLTEEQWKDARKTYTAVFEDMTGYVYSSDRKAEIDSLKKQCEKYFSMQPVIELLELCKYVKNNGANITSAQRDSVKVRHAEIKRELAGYEYDADKSVQIAALNDTVTTRINNTRWSSLKNTVVEEGMGMLDKMYDWLEQW